MYGNLHLFLFLKEPVFEKFFYILRDLKLLERQNYGHATFGYLQGQTVFSSGVSQFLKYLTAF
jgi:hypothetical protein